MRRLIIAVLAIAANALAQGFTFTIGSPVASQDFQMKLHPTWKILEFVCEENNRCMFGKCTASDVQK